MKKIVLDRRILEVIDQEEYDRRTILNPDSKNLMAEDTAVLAPNGMIYPVNRVYTEEIPGVYDAGPLLLYTTPEGMEENPDYQQDKIIDFENVGNLQESIMKQAELEQAERTILISPDNIFTPVPQETDPPEMALLKEAITKKRIDLDNYKQRFGSDYNNDKRLFDQSSITFFKMKRVCDILDIEITLTLKDKPGAPNPIGETLSSVITRGKEEV